ncbi:MAG: efflux RND transporter periplasmic adaptor subunit [Armatimonadetes bacterium]|nr:efflux RND transporter periplasmic adaptor subunit [Armatimonadota bacterium]
MRRGHRYYPLLIIGLAALAGCPDKEAQEQARVQLALLKDQTIPVTFVEPRVQSFNVEVEVSGPLNTPHEIELGANVPGRLVLVTVKDGSPVKSGQLIARVQTVELQAQVRQASAAVERAERARVQAEKQARMTSDQTEARIRQAEAALSVAEASRELVRKGPREQEIRQAEEQVNAEKARAKKAEADLKRMRRLFDQDAVAKSDVDAAQLEFDTARADLRGAEEALDALEEGARPEEIRQADEAVRQAEEQVNVAKTDRALYEIRDEQVAGAAAALREAEALLERAQMQLADASIYSPVDGYVSGPPAQVGAVVMPGTPVATIIALEGVYLEGQIPEREIARINVGQSATVTVDAFPGVLFDGKIAAIRPSADPLGRLFGARIQVDDTTGRLRPGMFGRAKIVVERIENAVMVPSDALHREGDTNHLFVADGNRARRIEVELGATHDDWTQVYDLSPDSKVILGGTDVVSDGASIREELPAEESG